MQNFTTAPHRGGSGLLTTHSGSPNAALLIDFDNVTMGIRSDLTRQLKELLNSDIIKGKVAVQRAYADWRRYAQYIVPLSEASVDLIFAPAYGSSKKNATDIRLAIDALELVFTRPEIGTFILLSGDSDFSSLVLKLKEYGKYVIGVGLRESASDLLVQNCDEYYSYSSLTGLTRAGEEDSITSVDAWELAERAVNQMAADADVMRSDRLKQVMMELDPTFDEGQLGFTKFNKFLTEAAARNRLALKKLENGQYEVQPYERGQAETRDDRPRGRGRRDRKEEGRGRESREKSPAAESGSQPAPSAEPEARRQPSRAEKARPEAGTRGRPTPRAAPREHRAQGIDAGYELLRRAVRELTDGAGDAARDSDIKRKMLELENGWDEAALGFTKFSRFLRQAHDAEVVDLTRNPDGFFEARLARSSGRAQPPTQREPEREKGRDTSRESRDRSGRGARDREAGAQRSAPTGEPAEAAPVASSAAEPSDTTERASSERADTRQVARQGSDSEAKAEQADARVAQPAESTTQPTQPAEPTTRPAQPAAQPPAQAGRAGGFGRRGRRVGSEGPPPLLPGQVVGGRGARAESTEAETAQPAEADEAAEAAQPAVAAEAAEPAGPTAGPAEPALETRQEPAAPPPDEFREAPGTSLVDPEVLGLPTEHGAVIRYLSNSYQGVGQKTAEALIEAFGADRVFQGLNDHPERVHEVLGAGRRTDALLDAWRRDFRRRTTAGSASGTTAGAEQPSS